MPETTINHGVLEDTRPLDDHDSALLEAAPPPAWKNPTPGGRYNMVVIGAGTAGLVTAAGAAGLGAKVALIERGLMGGDCLNFGCVPSKAIIRSARVAAEVRDAAAFGVNVPAGTKVDFSQVMDRMRRLRAKIAPHDSAKRFRALGIDVYLSEARFSGPDTVTVDGRDLRFARACIATGARAAAPPIPGLREAGYLTNETVFSLTELPRRLAVIGAGPIGCELEQTFARFGREVFLIEAMHGIMPNEDPDASEIVRQSLTRDGIRLMCCGKNLKISRTDNRKQLTVDSHGTHYELTVDEILVGAGRVPNVDNMGLDLAGVEFDKTGVKVNESMRTSNRRIYAAGDVCSRYKFTHAADAMARIVIQNALFFGRAKASRLIIPWCTYTDPEVAHVGMYEKDAKEKGIANETMSVDLGEVDRAILDGEEGFLKVLLAAGTDRILGATLVSRHAGETISELTTAVTHGLGLRKLASVIHPYPTQAEIIKRAADAFNRKRLTPRVQRLLTWMLARRR